MMVRQESVKEIVVSEGELQCDNVDTPADLSEVGGES